MDSTNIYIYFVINLGGLLISYRPLFPQPTSAQPQQPHCLLTLERFAWLLPVLPRFDEEELLKVLLFFFDHFEELLCLRFEELLCWRFEELRKELLLFFFEDFFHVLKKLCESYQPNIARIANAVQVTIWL